MALNEYDITFSFPEISNVAEERENNSCDEQADSHENYMLSAPSSGNERCIHTNNMLANKLIKHTVITEGSAGDDAHPLFGQNIIPQKRTYSELNGKNVLKMKARNGRTNYVQKKMNSKLDPSSTLRRYSNKRSRSVKSQNLDKNSDRIGNLRTESELFISALKPLKVMKKGSIKTRSYSDLCATPGSAAAVATTTSTWLSLIAQAVSTPKYTSAHTASEYPPCPKRNSWPLLREMISKPPVTEVSISPASRQSLVTVQLQPANEVPKAKVVSKLEKEIKCECRFNRGQPCWFLFQEDRLRKERLHHLTLKRESLDLVILAKIAANINREEKTKKCQGRARQRCRVCYYHEGRQICRETFMFIHGICKGRLCALLQHYKKKGLSIRIHGNKANIPHHALSDEDSQRVLDFIRKYANSHCVSKFGRKPGSKSGGGLLIMSPTQSKLYIHHKYKLWCSENKFRVVSLRSFQTLWNKHLPYIVVLRGSNKTPVPNPETYKNEFSNMHQEVDFEGENVPEVTGGKTVCLPFSSSSKKTHNTLREVEVHEIDGYRQSHCDSSTQADLDCFIDRNVNRKRKSLPPRNVELSSCQPESAERDSKHNQILSEQRILHPFMGTDHIDISLGATDSVTDSCRDTCVVQGSLHQLDLHYPFLNGEQDISHKTNLSQSYPKVAINILRQQATVTLSVSKDLRDIFSKPYIPSTKIPSSHSTQSLPPPSQLLDACSMQCCDRSATEVSGSNDLCAQSRSAFLPPQGPDLSSSHQLEWQSYSAL